MKVASEHYHSSGTDDVDRDAETPRQSGKRKRDATNGTTARNSQSGMRKREFWAGLSRFLDAFFRLAFDDARQRPTFNS